MYINYFGFTEKPFKLKPDARFFYSTPDYQKAHDDIIEGIESRHSLTALIGSSGSGKTMLLRRCMQELEKDNIQLLNFTNTTLPFSEVVDYLCENLGLAGDSGSVADRMQRLQYSLLQKDEEGLKVVLVIDDAHNLTTDTLNDLLSIANPPNVDRPMIITLMAGLPELVERLERLEHPPHVARLNALAESDVANFIGHQLQTAGYPRQDIFTPNSVEAITEYTKGNPRTISSLCDAALFIASLEDQRLVSPEIIEKAARQCFLIEPERLVYEYPDLPGDTDKPDTGAGNTNTSRNNPDNDDDDGSGMDNLPSSAEPAIAVQPGLASTKAGDVLGLRFGDASAELAAAGFTPPTVDEESIAAAGRYEQTPADTGNSLDALRQNRSAEAADLPRQSGQAPQRVTLTDDFAGTPRAGSQDSSPPGGPRIVSGLTTVGGEFRLEPKRRRSYRWLRLTLAVIVFLAVLSTAVWYKPEFFNMTRAQADWYADRVQFHAELYANRVKTLIGGLMNNQPPAPSAQDEGTGMAAADGNTDNAGKSAGGTDEQTAMPQSETSSPVTTPVATGQQDDSALSSTDTAADAMVENNAADTITDNNPDDAGEMQTAESIAAQSPPDATQTGSETSATPVTTSPDVVIVNEETDFQPLQQPLASGGQQPLSDDTTDDSAADNPAPAPMPAETPAERISSADNMTQFQPAPAQSPEPQDNLSTGGDAGSDNEVTIAMTPADVQSQDSSTDGADEQSEDTPATMQEVEPIAENNTTTAVSEASAEPSATADTPADAQTQDEMTTTPEAAAPAVDTEVQTLLERAGQQMSARRLTTPEDDNALATYRAILEIDPDNLEAQRGLEDIRETYKGWAASALRDNEFANAIRYYERALRVDPDDTEVQQALDQVRQLQ